MRDDERINDEERKTQDMSAVADYGGEKSNRAKLVEAEGDDYEDVPVKDSTFRGRMSNLWYHHKWKIILIPCAFLLLVSGITQLTGNEKVDASVMYAGPAVISGDKYSMLDETLDEILSEDLDGDGNKNAYLYVITYMSQKQIEAQKKEYFDNGIHDVTYNAQANQEAYSSFNDMIFAGEAGVMFLDTELFERVRDAGGLVTLESVLGEKPGSAVDDYGVRLGNTAIYKFYKSVQLMPEDTVICLRGPSTVGGVFVSEKSAEKTYERNRALFCDILNFELPEGFAQ